MKLAPVTEGERIRQLDGIRGFALFGILLVNMPSFLYPLLFLPEEGLTSAETAVDGIIRLLFNMFVQTKFYTIFAFLFGVGFYLFMNRAESKQLPYSSLFARRLGVLLLFGVAHLVFLWYGDILHTYALAGFLLMLFYKASERAIKIWAWTLLLAVQSLYALMLLIPEEYVPEIDMHGLVDQAIHAYSNGTVGEWLQFRLAHEIPLIVSNGIFVVISVLPLFLFGFLAAKRGIFSSTKQHLPAIRRAWWSGLCLSVVLVPMIPLAQLGIIDFPSSRYIAAQSFITWSGLSLSVFYVTSLILLYQKEREKHLFKHLEPVGRMALSNYLAQTILIVLIVRLGDLYGEANLLLGLIISLTIFIMQVFVSRWWLDKYQFGPAEWLWRCLTYGKFVPMKR